MLKFNQGILYMKIKINYLWKKVENMKILSTGIKFFKN